MDSIKAVESVAQGRAMVKAAEVLGVSVEFHPHGSWMMADGSGPVFLSCMDKLTPGPRDAWLWQDADGTSYKLLPDPCTHCPTLKRGYVRAAIGSL